MKADIKLLKEMIIVVIARGGKREIYTTVYIDSTVVDNVIGRGKIEDIVSIQFLDKNTDNDGWWYCRKAELSDLINHLRDVRLYCFGLFR